jgi:hypothetical protein
MVKAALEHYKVIGGRPLLAGKVLEVLAGLIPPSTIVRKLPMSKLISYVDCGAGEWARRESSCISTILGSCS